MARPKGLPKTGGRKKGAPNKTTQALKDAILEAGALAGNGDLVAYLKAQAVANPTPFMGLLGRVLPLQVAGDKDNPLALTIVERLIVRSQNKDG